jgi:hypothetical protein
MCPSAIIRLLYAGEKESPQKKPNFLMNVLNTVDDSIDSIFYGRGRSRNAILEQPKAAVFSHSAIDEEEDETFVSNNTEPLIDLFIELFQLTGFRKQAVVLFLQQLFGDTVERRVTESIRDALSQERVLKTLIQVKDTYWPNDVFSNGVKPRTTDEKLKTKFEANRKIMTLIPDLFGGLVGRQNARKGAMRFSTMFQNQRLNAHLMYKIFD